MKTWLSLSYIGRKKFLIPYFAFNKKCSTQWTIYLFNFNDCEDELSRSLVCSSHFLKTWVTWWVKDMRLKDSECSYEKVQLLCGICLLKKWCSFPKLLIMKPSHFSSSIYCLWPREWKEGPTVGFVRKELTANRRVELTYYFRN